MVWLRDLQHLQSNHLSPAFSGYAAPRLDAATRRALARRCLPRVGCGTSQSLADCWFSRLSHIAPVGDAAFWCVQLKAGCSARHGGEADMNNLIDVHASASATRDLKGDDMSTTSETLPIVIATLLHEQGTTGVHSHFNAFREYLQARGQPVCVVTPYHTKRVLAYPINGVRYTIDRLYGEASDWWYYYWHYVFLKQALRQMLRDGMPARVYAQCPISAKAALEVRNPATQCVVLVTHFNVSQAIEWADRGKIKHGGHVFRGIQQLEQSVLPRVDGIVYVSQFMKGQLEARIAGLERVKSTVIPNFVDSPVDADDAADIHGDLINIGTLQQRKNQYYLLDVLKHANTMGHRYALTLVGGWPIRGQLVQLAREYGGVEQVKFLGSQQNAARGGGGRRRD